MNRPLFYLPALHRRSAPDWLPEAVLFFPPGLPGAGEAEPGMTAHEALRAAREALPFKDRDALALLDEMLGLGDACADGGFLRQLYANRECMEGRAKWQGAPGEFADLAAFAATGAAPQPGAQKSADDGGALSPAVARALTDCQKVLLLVWWREEKLLELAGLEQRFLAAESALNAALAEDEEPAPARDESAAGPEDSGIPWRVVLDAAAPFLPENAAFFSADASVARDLRDSGALRALPEDGAALFSGWPVEHGSGLLYARLPVWRLVGRKGPLDERPWLAREVEIYVTAPGSEPGAGVEGGFV